MSIAETIKGLRVEYNLTQGQLASALGITQDSISLWECGKRLPDLQYVLKLADIFHVSADYLLGRTDDLGNISLLSQGTPPSKKERELLAIFRQMTEAQQNRFLGIGEGMIEGATAAERRKK